MVDLRQEKWVLILKPISLGVNLPCFIRLKSNNVYSKNKTKLTIVITIWNNELRINKPTRLAITLIIASLVGLFIRNSLFHIVITMVSLVLFLLYTLFNNDME
jgi:hypothetical protein